ncbi:MAG: immunoglobulin domain-containing protein, partial [Limisphaerales bacterium]
LGSPNLPNRMCARLAVDPLNFNVVYAAFAGFNSDNLYRTTDGGSTWTNLSSGLPAATIYSIVIAPFNSTLLYVGTEVGVFGSANGGVSWSPANEGPASVSVRELFWAQNYLFAATHGRGMYRIALGLLPVITSQPANEFVSVGDSVSFCVTTTATVPVTYAWQLNGAPIVGATNPCYSVSNVQSADSGDQFQCLVSSSYGTVTSSTATLTVASAPLIVQQPQSQSYLDVGTSVTFNVGALGQSPLYYQWFFGGTSLSGATSSSLTLNNVQVSNAGSYQVVISNSVGSASSDVATLSVVGLPSSGTYSGGQLGFIARSAQVDYPGADEASVLNSIAAMEAALGPITTNASDNGLPSAGQFNDPLTGLYCANTCNLSNADANGCFLVPGYINMDLDGPTDQNGDFTSSDGVSGWPKKPFPGIPGNSLFTPVKSEFAVSYTAYVYLPAGVTQFGVNSDDGFLLTLSSTRNPNDIFTRRFAGQYDGGRGSFDSIVNFNAPAAGGYALRLDYEQGGGGGTCELFTVTNGVKVLVNDTNTAGCLLAYPAPEIYANAYAVKAVPSPGQSQVPLGTPITIVLQDGIPNAVNLSSILLRVNGQAVAPTITQAPSFLPNGKRIGNITTIYYPSTGVSGALSSVELSYADTGTNLTDRTWPFTYETSLPTNSIVASPNQGSTNSGFVVYPWHTSASNPNDVQVWTEEQILGLHGSNLALLTNWPNSQNQSVSNAVAGPQGLFFPYTNFMNWDIAGPTDGFGDFVAPGYPKQEFPGIVTSNYPNESGSPATDGNNVSMLVEAWLKFPSAGTWQMGVNSDDGFSVKSGQAPGDVFGQTVGQFQGGRGASDTICSFFVPQPGLYPFRLLYEQGGGGGLCEWFTMSPTGQRVLINDASQGTNAIYSYMSALNCPIYVAAVTPVIGAQSLGVTPVISASIVDGTQTHLAFVAMWLNGSPASISVNRNNSATTAIVEEPSGSVLLVPGATNQAAIVYGDDSDPPKVFTNTWNFLADPIVATQSGPAYYQSPGSLTVSCSVRCAIGRAFTALSWQPTPPAGWTVASVAGTGNPKISGSQITFTGPWTNPLNFSYTVNVPSGQTTTQNILGRAIGQVTGITGTINVPAALAPYVVNHGTVLSLGLQTNSPVLKIQGDIGRTYRIQASSNLVSWSDLFSFSQNTQVLQTNVPANQPATFYRSISP